MNTIEERAKEEGLIALEASKGLDENIVIEQPNGLKFNGIPEYIANVAATAYEKGATEQDPISRADERDKMIVKAWEIFKYISVNQLDADMEYAHNIFIEKMKGDTK